MAADRSASGCKFAAENSENSAGAPPTQPAPCLRKAALLGIPSVDTGSLQELVFAV
jgi:hypothetical protein